MAVRAEEIRVPRPRPGLVARVRGALDREEVLGPVFVTPALLLLLLLVAYPFVVALYFSMSDAFNLPAYEKLQDHPVLRTDPKYAHLRGEGVQYHTYGWPAPPSDKVQLITNTYLLPNMIAKAVTGTSTKDSIAWAENEMKKILAG